MTKRNILARQSIDVISPNRDAIGQNRASNTNQADGTYLSAGANNILVMDRYRRYDAGPVTSQRTSSNALRHTSHVTSLAALTIALANLCNALYSAVLRCSPTWARVECR